MARLSKKVATGPVGLLSTYDAGSVTEALNSLFYFILIALNLKSHLHLTATIPDSVAVDDVSYFSVHSGCFIFTFPSQVT